MKITFISDTLLTEKAAPISALAKALQSNNNDITMILPYYEKQYQNESINFNISESNCVSLPCGKYNITVFKTIINGIKHIFIYNSKLFSRENTWGYPDDALRTAVFCSAAIEAIDETDYIFTDSENTALVPVYLKFKYNHISKYKNIKAYHYINSSVFTKYDKINTTTTFGISKEDSRLLTDNSSINLTKAAIITASRIFVGENAAHVLYSNSDEIHHAAVQFGFKLRKMRMGIDYDIFSPEKDRDIHKTFSTKDLSGKTENKLYVQQHLYLEDNVDIPMVILFPDRNKSIMTRILHDMMKCDMQIIILSKKNDHHQISSCTKRTVIINEYSSQIMKILFSAADLSVFGGFESPCGNPSYISAAYGCVPIVPSHRFFDFGFSYYNKLTCDGNGYTYDTEVAQDLMYTLWDALGLYRHDRRNFNRLVQNTMKKVFSVHNTAEIVEAETEKTLYSFI